VGAGLVAVRMHLDGAPESLYCVALKWEKLEERRKYNRLCMLYKIKNGLVDIDSHQYIPVGSSP
jgi:hypothetical protein